MHITNKSSLFVIFNRISMTTPSPPLIPIAHTPLPPSPLPHPTNPARVQHHNDSLPLSNHHQNKLQVT